MKFFQTAPDGGKDSGVTGFFVIEIKSLFSIVFLRFKKGTREALHSHAFNAVTWWLKGKVEEHRMFDRTRPHWANIHTYLPSWIPKITKRDNIHKVVALEETWALSFRGPWTDRWTEYHPSTGKFVTLTHGRRVVSDQ